MHDLTSRLAFAARWIASTREGRCATILLLLGVVGVFGGCTNLQDIDRRIADVLDDSALFVDETTQPRYDISEATTDNDAPALAYDERPSTDNPKAESLEVDVVRREADQLIARLQGYSELPDDAMRLDLAGAVAYAVRNSPDYRFAEEAYLLSVISLLVERHLWGPRFFNDLSAEITTVPLAELTQLDGRFDTTARLVNEFRVTQRLPYGGEVAVRAIVQASQDLYNRVEGEDRQTASIILEADIPLLRGAGQVAREDLIQANRNVIYAARDFARFRRQFLFDVSSDYLTLVVNFQAIDNARRRVASSEQLEARQQALSDAGRNTPAELAEAQNETLDAIDDLNVAAESYRLSIDNFKVLIGMDVEEPLVIEPQYIDLPMPGVDLNEAVYAALQYRLDLQTERDQVEDSRRRIDVARNQLLGDLDVTGQVAFLTDPELARAGLQFGLGNTEFRAGITYGMPLDRTIEQANLRASQIQYQRADRSYQQFRDTVGTQVRAAVRRIDSAAFSLEIQERNVKTAELREASIAADPGRATITQQTDAINQTAAALGARDRARRELDVAILGYLLTSGQLRVTDNGEFQPLPGMYGAGPATGGGAVR